MSTQLTDRIIESTLTNPATIVKAPPGAGKSYLAALIAGVHTAGAGQSLAVATPTREQGLDLAIAIAAAYPNVPVHWHSPAAIPTGAPANLYHTLKAADLPTDTHVAVGTIAKWGFYNGGVIDRYETLLIDEAYQVTDAAFATITHVAPNYVLIGDPGQIAPVVTADMSTWAHLPDAPTRQAPYTLTHRHPKTPVFELPSTRRFGQNTASIVADTFYDFTWDSIAPTTTLTVPHPWFTALNDGVGLGALVLPADETAPRNDPQIAATIATAANTALNTGTLTRDGKQQPLGTVYVSCAHIDQVAAVRAACAGLNVIADTAERLQGRQTGFTITWHPAASVPTVGQFQRDTGRLCVMLSRHQAANLTVMRADTAHKLGTYTSGGRTLGVPDDSYTAWQASTSITTHLNENGVHL